MGLNMNAKSYACLALALFFAAPLLIGLVDLWFWVVLDFIPSGIIWDGPKIMSVWALLFPSMGFFMAAELTSN
jgi:hypothetical protein